MTANDKKKHFYDPADKGCAARSKIYSWLADAFSYPANTTQGPFALKETEALFRELPFDFELGLNNRIEFPDRSELQETYSRFFDVSDKIPLISLLERRYTTVSDQQLWEDLLRFYSHFHLDFSKGFSTEQIDHLSTELSFMHYLSFLQARRGPDKESVERGQRDFLSEHLQVFAVGVSDKLTTGKELNIYSQLAEILTAFVQADHLFLNRRQPVAD